MGIGIGDTLRSERERQGRNLEAAARDIRVRSDYLQALEEEDFGVFGGDVYAKGFLASYARHLGLDPEPLLDSYRRHVQRDEYNPMELATEPVARAGGGRLPGWLSGLVIVVLVLIVALTASSLIGGRSPDPSGGFPLPSPPPAAVSQSPTPSPSASPSPSPSPSPTFDGVNLELLVSERCWMRVEVDGEERVVRIFEPGETPVFEAAEQVTIRFGNPGGVRAVLNGDNLGSPGPRGEPTTVTFDGRGMTRVDDGGGSA